MSISFKYWNDCVDELDMEDMWLVPEVCSEWLNAGETKGEKIHLSRDPDGQAYLTQTEMRAVADIIVQRHFHSSVDPDMICAIVELESDRRIFASRYDKKIKETTIGLMQVLPKNVEWLSSEHGYHAYEVKEKPELLYRPFINVYFGSAYLKWLSRFEDIGRSEEFIIRAYRGGTKKPMHKSTLPYWKRFLSVKESFLSVKSSDEAPLAAENSIPEESAVADTFVSGYTYWDSRASAEDMADMWNLPEVAKEWNKSGEKRGKVRFPHDDEKRPYLSPAELRAVAEIILFKHFASKRLKSTVLCAVAEVSSKRFVNGVGERPGIMGINYATALWLRNELGYKAYKVESPEDLCNPFVSIYFGAAYLAWLSDYEGRDMHAYLNVLATKLQFFPKLVRERQPQFVVQAYFGGPQNVNLQETGPHWLKFEEALGRYEDMKRESGSCTIL